MEDRRVAIWQGARPLIGTVVGVGIFGLPYVFAQAGYVYGAVQLVLVAALALLTYFIFSDLLAINKGHVRFVAVVGNQLGPFGRAMAAVAFFGTLWGAMLAYMIVGGQFAATVFRPFLGGEVFNYQLAFWVIASACIVGGGLFVRRLQAILIPVFFIMIAALALYALPNLHVEYLATLDSSQMFAPFGALVFAFSGFSAVPECREALGRRKQLLHRSLALATLLVTGLYALFTLAIVGMTGAFTSVQTVDGLRLAAEPWLAVFVSVIGLCTVFTAFLSVGLALTNSLLYDFRGRFLSSWWLAVIVPVCLFLFGARDFINVIGTTGGLLGGLSGIVLVVAYERARMTAQLPKRALALPQGLVGLAFIVFVSMIFLTILEIA
jgi:tyrosine-specific transport protein